MEQTKLAIEEIAAFRAKLGSILTEEHLRHRCDSVLITLENGLRHMVDMPVIHAGDNTVKAFEPTPITHVLGQTVTPRTTFNEADITPDNEDVSALRREVEEAYKTFATRSNESILESLEDMTIRGVAMKAGVEVTSTYPAKVDAAFIDEIKAAILDKENVRLAGERTEKVNEAYAKYKAGYDALVKQYNQTNTGNVTEDMEAAAKSDMLTALVNGQDLDALVRGALDAQETAFKNATTEAPATEETKVEAPAATTTENKTDAKAATKTTGKK